MSKVKKLARIENYDDLARLNAKLMEDIYNDDKLNPMEKIKGMRICVLNQGQINRDVNIRRKEAIKLGLKIDGGMRQLGFDEADV